MIDLKKMKKKESNILFCKCNPDPLVSICTAVVLQFVIYCTCTCMCTIIFMSFFMILEVAEGRRNTLYHIISYQSRLCQTNIQVNTAEMTSYLFLYFCVYHISFHWLILKCYPIRLSFIYSAYSIS